MRGERVRVGLVVAAAAAACAAVVPGLTHGFWRDEAATATVAIRSWSDLFRLLPKAEGGFAGYEVFIHAWVAVFGAGEGWLRVPSLLGVFVAIVASGLLAGRLGVRWAGPITAVLLALHPTFVPFYGVEARGYALGSGLVAVAALAARRAADGERRFVGPTFCLAATAAITMHFLIVLPVAAISLWILASARADRRRIVWLVPPGIAAAGMYALTSRATVLQSWIAKPGPKEIVNVAADTFTPGMAVLAGALLLAGWALARNGGEPRPPAPDPVEGAAAGPGRLVLARTTRLDLLVLGGWLAGPSIIMLAYSLASKPSLLPRYVLPSVQAGAVLLGVATDAVLDAWRARHGRTTTADATIVLVAGLIGLIAASVLQGALRPAPKSEDLRAASRYLLAHDEPGDAILYAPTWAEAGMRWYLVEHPAAANAVDGPQDLSRDPSTSARAEGRLFSPPLDEDAIRAALVTHDRVWIIGYPNRSKWQPVPERGMDLAAEVRSCWTEVSQRKRGISIQLWQRPAGLPAGQICPD